MARGSFKVTHVATRRLNGTTRTSIDTPLDKAVVVEELRLECPQ